MIKPYYEPSEDSFLLLEQVKLHSCGKVLDIGTGSGILAIEAAKHATSVLAVDINKIALSFAAQNAAKQKIKNITFRHSDLFSKVKGKYDTIIFNPPYLPQDEGIEDPAIYGGKQGYEIIGRFLAAAGGYLSDDGKILLLFSSLSNRQKIDEIIADNIFISELLSTKHIFFEDLYLYLIKKSPLLIKLVTVKNLRPLAKGKRGCVYIGIYKNKKVAIKLKNPRSASPARIEIEAAFLKTINKKKIGPKFIDSAKDYLIMEYIEGTPIITWLESENRPRIISIIKNIFSQLFILDTLQISKEEMHRPPKHILIRKNLPVLIDFERARYSQKIHNITQFCQFLTSKRISDMLTSKQIRLDKQQTIKAAKAYSKKPTKENLEAILSLIQ